MHEATANSLLYDISDSYMPLMIDSPSLAAQLSQLFPELKLHYGPDVQIELGVRLSENESQTAIKFDASRGIVFGDSSLSDMKTNLQFYCSNSTTSQELALELEMSLQIVLNLTVNNFDIQVRIQD